MKKPMSKKSYIKGGLQHAKAYFLGSNERKSAWLLLSGVILSVVGLVVLTAIFAWWNVIFWTALTEMNLPLYIESMKILMLLVGVYTGISVIKDYLISILSIRWGTWLKQDLIDKYTKSYLHLGRHHAEDIPNPGQRIEEDAQSFVEQTLILSIDLFQSVLTQISFLGTLWVIGGAITVVIFSTSITIPGYLVWVAIVFAGVSTIITHKIGGILSRWTNRQKELAANFRNDMALLNEKGESIAQDHGEIYYKPLFTKRLLLIAANAYDLLRVKVRLTAFNSFYQQIAWIFPYIVAAPLYFAKKTTLGQLMDIGYAFGQIQMALSWFTNSYEPLARYAASVERIIELEQAMEEGLKDTRTQSIHVQENSTGKLRVSHLNIAYPSSTGLMMCELNLEFTPGENTVIKAPSGYGKSTLFKVMAGTWKYGQGEVSVANYDKMCFLPQQPVIQNDTLKAVLAYPNPVETYSDTQYEAVLYDVGSMDQFIGRLNETDMWSKSLSGGQQQRVSFARALLKKPEWLFLDESTSSLDEKSEHDMYSLLKSKLKGTTFISIAHKASVEKFHDRIVTFSADTHRNISIHEERRL